MTTTIDTRTAADAALEEVLPQVWRWVDPGVSDRCGTALSTGDGTVLIDPPAIGAEDRQRLEAEAGPIKHVLLTSARHAALAGVYRGAGVTVWAPQAAAGGDDGPEIDHLFGYEDRLPGGVLPLQLPEAAAPDEVAYLWPSAGEGLLITGDVLPVVGQTPVYREGDAPPMDAYLDAVKALLVAEPGTLAPAHQAPPEEQVIYATAWAAHIGSMT
ncbi:MAG TPA: MBL fold metallo-hydrolase, partial [Chloroflexota bacterium]|nr:MBL fold metallo-hydrolase [Chloroflexota bacterium]